MPVPNPSRQVRKAARLYAHITRRHTPWHHVLLLCRFLGLGMLVPVLFARPRLLSRDVLPGGRVLRAIVYKYDRHAKS